jgi:hypothetical protein
VPVSIREFLAFAGGDESGLLRPSGIDAFLSLAAIAGQVDIDRYDRAFAASLPG